VRLRLWMLVGIAVGLAVGIGHLPYLAGAPGSLAQISVRMVERAGHRLVGAAALHGASERVVRGLAATVALVAPGVAALALVGAARGVLVVRRLVAVMLLALAAAAFFALPTGAAVGVAGLALGAAAIAVVASGPLLVAPLVAVATVVGTGFLPRILSTANALAGPVGELHLALSNSVGAPLWLRAIGLIVATVPFVAALGLAVGA